MPNPTVPADAIGLPAFPPLIRHVLRVCAECSADIREHAATAAAEDAGALRALAAAVDRVAADWAAEQAGRGA